jgi:hypothetical protein
LLIQGFFIGASVRPGLRGSKQESFDIALNQLDAFFTFHLKQKGVPKVTASGSVPAIQGEWKQLGGGYGGSEGPQWITVDGEPTLIYAAHHDGFVFRWSPEKGLRVWRNDSPAGHKRDRLIIVTVFAAGCGKTRRTDLQDGLWVEALRGHRRRHRGVADLEVYATDSCYVLGCCGLWP